MRVPGGGPGCGPGGGGGPGCSGGYLVVVQSQPGRCKLKTQRWHPVKLKQIDFSRYTHYRHLRSVKHMI